MVTQDSPYDTGNVDVDQHGISHSSCTSVRCTGWNGVHTVNIVLSNRIHSLRSGAQPRRGSREWCKIQYNEVTCCGANGIHDLRS